ncbi:MAG TPA: NADH:ubiquinone reductase (Na(+)-transporting) subunit B [Candidatus Marinimicrobia bacterium]|jgi:Na+-transporting NADH:ubiquinone oxidoreductase subunit B|nr:NADH:ubiquinone reductase (Na(+)-transporting) subunit B [Candidatus Neomarinimicrobiota bacterium]MDP6230431.1 NADH:ubiquinone reductase (Na(+)-transporting) subunit B [Candidatus Neomarinimicrobiota bacterium]MDP7094586.1 NADH:ubiquinone reductase (Na(+)-transporting) subunit B [Candidatus Neomarinimicrobiota bacterium]MDP7512774.1 NADH:ubiquinone reductase (Na(+)-transporting) subunit B [Candidatus Neomarinimicrobiota bacterium]HBR86951.1 NADH:ubiquinone reductase (Na(+)-transporting) sub|tara:strand:+ start:3344 stop:4519 length:1176 start_codon:yes stop_codon:yes gene_type:complete
MKFLRKILDNLEPKFTKGGPLEKFHAVYNATDTILFSTDDKTESGPHIRDSIDNKRIMILVVVALLPCYIFGAINIGYQSSQFSGNERSVWENFWLGFGVILPILITAFATGAFWEVLFAVIRKHPISEGFLVTCALIPLLMPPTIPLWQVAAATTFGVVIGKEIFGGVGMNIFNPALVARAFIFFAYPSQISGDKVWLKVNGVSGATALAVPAAVENGNAVDLLTKITQFDYSWSNMFWGYIPGSIGETNKFLIIIGLLFLIITKIANWRVIVGALIGLFGTATLTNIMAPLSSNTMLTLPPHYHLVMGGFLFGLAFMATEPVTGAHTDKGRWIFGILFGALTVIIRSINPAYPEGTMLAILLMNAFAPLIDYYVVQGNIKRRMARYAAE